MSIKDRFEAVNDDYMKFELVTNKLSNRPDLNAFVLLDSLFPGDRDIVSAATHDEIFLDIDDDHIESLTDDQIADLVRCGVMFSDDGLCMFV